MKQSRSPVTSAWQQAVTELRQQQIPAVLVSVDSIVGSTPREPGARMIVTAQQLYGTIGGGNLEYQACHIARNQLKRDAEDGLQRFPQTHLVCQDAVDSVLVQFDQPIESFELISSHFPARDAGGLGKEARGCGLGLGGLVWFG